jgi:hypothetical protein
MLGMNADNQSIYQKRLDEINRLPEDQRQQALEMLSRDYQGRGELLGNQRSEAQGAYQGAMDSMPMGAQTAGPSGNPFAVAVANPLGSIAKGLEGYQAQQDKAAAETAMGKMSAGKEQATSALMGAQSNALRGGGGPMPGQPGGMPQPGTPEYEMMMRGQRNI